MVFRHASITARARDIPDAAIDRHLVFRYAMLPSPDASGLDLERFYANSGSPSHARGRAAEAMAPLAIRVLEQEVGGPERFRERLHRLTSAPRIASFWDAFADPLGPRWMRVRHDLVQGGAPLPWSAARETSAIAAFPHAAARLPVM